MLELKLADQVADLPQSVTWYLVVKNGNFTFLLLEFILADQVADLPALPHISSNASWDVYYRDVFGSHCGFFKKRLEFAFISQ